MGMLGISFGKKPEPTWSDKAKSALMAMDREDQEIASKEATYYGGEYPIFETGWDGEKTMGEWGAPREYEIYFESVRARSWEVYADSDIAKLLVKAKVEWVIGDGLKLQSEPVKDLIDTLNVDFDSEKFKTIAEARFRLHAKTRNSSHNKRETMHILARKALKCAIIGGDCLKIDRWENGGATVEVIDGRHISSPTDQKMLEAAKNKGNKIIHGVEINPAKEHVAFYVSQDNGEWNRIEAIGAKSGRVQATMIYGDEYRIDDVRGIPLFAASLEKLKKIDRYIEAVVTGTEQRSKVFMYTHHNHFSDGTDPFKAAVNEGYIHAETSKEEYFQQVDKNNRKIDTWSGGLHVNMSPGSELKTVSSNVELVIGPFVKDMLKYIAASMGIPYEVAVMMYENSFSASRMASQSYQQMINNDRTIFSYYFYQPTYNLQLDMDILNGRIPANGYFQARSSEDIIMVEAYRHARFTGPNVPQADPSKEVKAVILMLQNKLIEHERAVELLNGGDWSTIIATLGKEYYMIKELIPEEYQTPPNAESDTGDFTEEPKAGGD